MPDVQPVMFFGSRLLLISVLILLNKSRLTVHLKVYMFYIFNNSSDIFFFAQMNRMHE